MIVCTEAVSLFLTKRTNANVRRTNEQNIKKQISLISDARNSGKTNYSEYLAMRVDPNGLCLPLDRNIALNLNIKFLRERNGNV